jgi:hypothetical protein
MENPFESIDKRLTAIETELNLNADKREPKKVSYLTRQQTATLLHITLPTLHFYTLKGILKGSKIGNRVLYLETDVMAAIKEIPTWKFRRD